MIDWPRRIVRRARALTRSAALDHELDDEMRFHLDMEAEELARTRGIPLAEARRRAMVAFGGVDRHKEAHRDARGVRWLEEMVGDVGFAARSLRRTPGFLAVTVLALALGIGATTAIFSVVHGVLLRPLPYPEPDRVVQVWQLGADGKENAFSDPNFEDVRDQSRSFSALAQFSGVSTVSVAGASEPVRVRGARVSRGFFDVLGVKPAVGRLFAPEELRENGPAVVVVSHRFWRTYLSARPAVVSGGTLTFDGRVFSIVGVMPPELDFPRDVDLWVPRELEGRLPSRTAQNWYVLGRLAPGVSAEQASADAGAIAKRLKQQLGDRTWMSDVKVTPLQEQLTGKVKPVLQLLLAASGFLLLIACANVVNLLVARLATRQGELAVRVALGAGRGRLVRQFLAEALLLSLVGGGIGVWLAHAGVRALLAMDPGTLPRLQEVGVSVPVLLFALGVSVLTAVLLGLVAAWRATTGDVRESLMAAGRSQAQGSTGQRVRESLVVAQVALTLVLLVGAGLLGRSFYTLMSVDPGYRTERTVVLDLNLPSASDSVEARRLVQSYDLMLDRLRQLPGVREVGAVNALPLAGGGSRGNGTFLIMSSVDEPLDPRDYGKYLGDKARTGSAEYRLASAGYFRAMGVPLVRGRLFEDRDDAGSPHVAVISQSLAETRWPNEEPIGKVIQFGNMDGILTPFTVVGIVGDVREASLESKPRPTFYGHYKQRPRRISTMNLVVAGSADPAQTAGAAGRVVRELLPDVPPRIRSIETVIAESVADRRFILLLVGVFGGAALLLATLGVYGVIAFLVAQRQQELAVRVALGAQSGDVLRLVLRQGAVLALIGVAVGGAAAFGLTRVLAGTLEGMLYGISRTDPVAFGGVALLLAAVALVASWVPARRAAKVDPMRVLRGG